MTEKNGYQWPVIGEQSKISNQKSKMNLKILVPTGVFLEATVHQIQAESKAGEFCLKPRHIDYVTSLAPGLFSYVTETGIEKFLALDGGILTKQGAEVKIASRRAVAGELGELRRAVETMQGGRDEQEKKTRTAMAGLEVNFLRRFLEMGRR
jgi:F-type H+-transporting ATPase subunit epsilon